MFKQLRLRAEDAEDLTVISACLQDALTSVADTRFQPRQRRFVALFSRFAWEDMQAGKQPEGQRAEGQRIRCGLHFDNVLRVQGQGIAQDDNAGLLPLLAITAAAGEANVTITLAFAGGVTHLPGARCFVRPPLHLCAPSAPPRLPAPKLYYPPVPATPSR